MKKIYLSLFFAFFNMAYGQSQTVKIQTNFSSWSGNNPAGWKGSKTNFAADSIIKVTSGMNYGTAAVQLNNTTSTHKRFTSQPTSVTQGKAYSVKYWAKGYGEIRFGLFDNDLSNGDFGYTYAPYNTLNSSNWVMLTQQVVADTTYNSAEFIFSVRNTLTGGSHVQLDSVIITEENFVPPSVSVYNIQYTTASNGASTYDGQTVSTGGIVTAFRDFGKGVDRGYYIQSGTGAWSGVWVADSVNNVARGDSIVIVGKVREFFSRTQIEGVTSFSLVGQTTAPAPSVVTLANAKSEAYEGVLVKVLNVKATSNPDAFGNYTITDDSNSVVLNVSNQISAFTADSVSINKNYNITGVINYSFGNFSLNPRTKFDVEMLTGFREISILNTRIFPNPTQDVLTITFSKPLKAHIEVLNILGETVVFNSFNGDKLVLDVSKLNSGIYFVNIDAGEQKISKRFVKE